MCFKWCDARALNPVELHAERISNLLREQAEELNMRGINFPVKLQDIEKFEKQNPEISINVFGFENKQRERDRAHKLLVDFRWEERSLLFDKEHESTVIFPNK